MYFVQINCRESFNTLLGASIQTLHVHAVDLSKLHILGLLHEELHDNLIEHILEAYAVGTPGSTVMISDTYLPGQTIYVDRRI